MLFALGLMAIATAVLLAVHTTALIAALLAIELFVFVVVASIYRADRRPRQKHQVK